MKKILMIAITAAVTAAALAGCGKKEIDVSTLATTLVNEGKFAEQLAEIGTEITEKRYDIDDSDVIMCAAFAGTKAVTDEVFVVKTSDTKTVEEKVREHWDSQIETYNDYLPSEVPKLNDAILYTYNDTVIFCVSEDSALAQQIISDYTTN